MLRLPKLIVPEQKFAARKWLLRGIAAVLRNTANPSFFG
jgi:hypothetical protein